MNKPFVVVFYPWDGRSGEDGKGTSKGGEVGAGSKLISIADAAAAA